MSVKGGFLDGVRLDFANGLNCFIGGRGTGKTTVLELIRYAFDALPSKEDDGEENRRICSLVAQNLAGGRVHVEFQTKNGLTYVVARSWDEEPVVLTADGQPTQLTLKSGGVFRADIFSQNEVERIADRSTSQLVLIDRFQTDAVADIDSQLREILQSLRANSNQLLSLEGRHAELREEIATLPEVEEKLKAFAGAGGDNAAVVDQAHSAKALRDRERRAIEAVGDTLTDYRERIQSRTGWFAQQVKSHLTGDILAGPNAVVLAELSKQLAACGNDIDILLRQIGDRLGEAQTHLEQINVKLSNAHNQQELAFRALIEQHEVLMEQATERAHLERLRNELLGKRRALDEIVAQLSNLRNQRACLLQRQSELRDRRFSIRQQVAQGINAKVSPMIRVRLEQFGEVGEYYLLLAGALKGAGLQHNVVAQKIATCLPPRDLSELVKSRNSQSLVDQSGINAAQAMKVVEALRDHQILFDLEAVELNDKPRIELKDGDAYKDSLSISKGQKCTSILPILLLDSDRPLLVDQPEDNLDNGFIYETVVSRVREVKNERQLIFVTHNPNIPVLGDAGKVFVFKSNGSRGWIEKDGTVDDCRGYIVSLLEGGEEAFKLRQQRYKY
ncbi:MAG: AAA family ATPase [Planctomycetes bacterium]|nr:AAA family ATPase [Planctomycetota bacterium]